MTAGDPVTGDPFTWDPGQYLKFGGARRRPALDLMGRLDLAAPGVVYDLGCGTGVLARLMAERWPGANVTGVDGSPDMLDKARAEGGSVHWVEADLAEWRPDEPADLIYSNAALHWLDDHAALFPRLMAGLAPGGVLAVQMPRNFEAPSHTCMAEAAAAGPWRDALKGVRRATPVATPETYYDILASLSTSLDIWETVYTHVLDGENPVVEWTRGTALRPLLEALDSAPAEAFLADYAARIARAYPPRPDGKTLFPFRRLFVIAVK